MVKVDNFGRILEATRQVNIYGGITWETVKISLGVQIS